MVAMAEDPYVNCKEMASGREVFYVRRWEYLRNVSPISEDKYE